MKKISIMDINGYFQTPFRNRRLKLFKDVIQPTPETRILDVGGNPWYWDKLEVAAKITILNPDPVSDDLAKRYRQFDIVAADGCNLPYGRNTQRGKRPASDRSA